MPSTKGYRIVQPSNEAKRRLIDVRKPQNAAKIAEAYISGYMKL